MTSEIKVNGLCGAVFRMLGAVISPQGKRGKLVVLIYHRVLPERDPMLDGEVDAATFEWHMATLAKHFNVLPLSEAAARLQDGSLPSRAACVTFDDGYENNQSIALPILQKYGVPATFFIATDFLNGGIMWNDKVIESVRLAEGDVLDLTEISLGKHQLGDLVARSQLAKQLVKQLKHLDYEIRTEQVDQLSQQAGVQLPDDLMMRDAQVRALKDGGMEIGCHTHTHPILACVENTFARQEIMTNKEILEDIVGGRISLFAYPNGRPGSDYTDEHVALVRELGFSAAVSTAWGAAGSGADLHQLPRFTPWDSSPSRWVMSLLRQYL